MRCGACAGSAGGSEWMWSLASLGLVRVVSLSFLRKPRRIISVDRQQIRLALILLPRHVGAKDHACPNTRLAIREQRRPHPSLSFRLTLLLPSLSTIFLSKCKLSTKMKRLKTENQRIGRHWKPWNPFLRPVRLLRLAATSWRRYAVLAKYP